MTGSRIPKGWSFELIDAEDKAYGRVEWGISKGGPGGPMSACMGGRSPDYAKALEEAAAAATKWDRDNAPQPAAPPAWMVEVAREVEARMADDAGLSSLAASVRAGEGKGGYQAASIDALRLAIERGHVVEPRPMPSDDDLLKAVREDAAQALRAAGYAQPLIDRVLRGGSDGDIWVTAALQARRNMLREMGVVDPDFREVGEPVKWGAEPAEMVRKTALRALRPDGRAATFNVEGEARAVDLEAALKRAFAAGWSEAKHLLLEMQGGGSPASYTDRKRERVARILSTLPAKE